MNSFYRSRALTAVLLTLDAAALALLWKLAYLIRLSLNPGAGGAALPLITSHINPAGNYYTSLAYLLPPWLAIFAYYGHYSHRERLSGLTEFSRILKCALAILIGTFALAFLFKEYDLGRSIVILHSSFTFLYLYLSRSILRWRKGQAFKSGHGLIKTIIVGAGKTGQSVAQRISNHREIGYQLVGFVDDDPAKLGQDLTGGKVLGTIADLKNLLAGHQIEEVFIAIPSLPQNRALNLIVECEAHNPTFHVVSHAFEVITDRSRLDVMTEIPVHQLPGGRMPQPRACAKRALDLALALPLLLLSLVWMIPAALLIRLTSKGPAIFKQTRIGRHGAPFLMYKFRTMYLDAPQYALAPDNPQDPRITPIGRFLRKYSLDEFPQLWNVIRGEMSLVGPRPEMPFIVEQYEDWQRYRLTVKPGVTGLWQTIGRKNLPLELNLEYDLYYIKNQTLLLDIIIIFRTIPAVLFGRGAY